MKLIYEMNESRSKTISTDWTDEVILIRQNLRALTGKSSTVFQEEVLKYSALSFRVKRPRNHMNYMKSQAMEGV